MRGLGIGILLTTLILAIANPKEKLSDTEIKERAQALGMEMKDNSGLDKALDKLELTVTPTQAPTKKPTKNPTAIPTKKPTPQPTKKPKKTPTKAPAKKSVSANKKYAKKISFTIYSGMSSRKVAKLLASKGIIKDAVDFNQYMKKAGKVGVIRVGTYKVAKGTSYDEIINNITKK